MSTQTNGTPFQQWQNFAPPYAYDPAVTIAESTSQIVGAINDSAQNATAERFGISKDIAQSTLGLRDAVEKGNVGISTALERTAGQNQAATERVGNQLGTAVERVGGGAMATTERTGGNILAAVERVAGENRLTTTVSDAASRQASADSARDLSIAIERNGANSISATQQINTSLLGSIERNAGENRVQTLLGSASTDAKLADVRHSILNDVHRVGSSAATDYRLCMGNTPKHERYVYPICHRNGKGKCRHTINTGTELCIYFIRKPENGFSTFITNIEPVCVCIVRTAKDEGNPWVETGQPVCNFTVGTTEVRGCSFRPNGRSKIRCT
jgi:hypothetical protein